MRGVKTEGKREVPTPVRGEFSFGPYTFDDVTLELRRDGEPLRLSHQPALLLKLLLSRASEIVTREEIQRSCWPETEHGADSAINAAVRQIRRTLEYSAQAPGLLETLPRRGYRFNPPVEWRPIESATLSLATSAAIRRSSRHRILSAMAAVLVFFLLAWIQVRRQSVPEDELLSEQLRLTFSKAMALVGTEEPPKVEQSIALFQQVLANEPEFAPAWAGLAEAQFLAGDRTAARVAAHTALGKDPNSASAHHVQGFIYLAEDWDFAAAEQSMAEAVRLAPRHFRYRASLAHSLIAQGKMDAAALQLDEIWGQEGLRYALESDVGWLEFLLGRYDRSYHLCASVAELTEPQGWGENCAIASLVRLKRLEEAVARAETVLKLNESDDPPWSPDGSLRSKLRAFWERRIRILAAEGYASHYELAVLYAELGRIDDALAALEISAEERSTMFVVVSQDPAFDSLRALGRFQALTPPASR